jgi:hypothetical protein
VVFFGSFYLINLMLAVVAMSYEEEAEANSAVSVQLCMPLRSEQWRCGLQERAKEAEEAEANAKRTDREEECTIRTNTTPNLGGRGAGRASASGAVLVEPEEKCGRCQLRSSLEALPQPVTNGNGNAKCTHARNASGESAQQQIDRQGHEQESKT